MHDEYFEERATHKESRGGLHCSNGSFRRPRCCCWPNEQTNWWEHTFAKSNTVRQAKYAEILANTTLHRVFFAKIHKSAWSLISTYFVVNQILHWIGHKMANCISHVDTVDCPCRYFHYRAILRRGYLREASSWTLRVTAFWKSQVCR